MSKKKSILSFVGSLLFLIFVATVFCYTDTIAANTTITVGKKGSGADYECDPGNAHNGINEALIKANELGGATVVLKGSTTYTIKNTLDIFSNTTLTGESGAKLKLGNGLRWSSMQPMIRSANEKNIKIHGFEIDGNYEKNTHFKRGTGYFNMIGFTRCSDVEIYDMYLHDSLGYGYRANYGFNVKFHNNKIERLGNDSFYCLQMKNIQFFNNNVVIHTNNAVRINACRDVAIYDNYITSVEKSGSSGIRLDANNKTISENIQVYSNKIYKTYGPGILLTRIGNAGTPTSEARIYNNDFIETGRDPNIDWAGGVIVNGWKKVVIENNTFDGTYGFGIAQMNPKKPQKITSAGSDYTTYIIKNTIKNIKKHPNTGSGIAIYNELSTNKLILQDNKLIGNPLNYKGENITNATPDVLEGLNNMWSEVGDAIDTTDSSGMGSWNWDSFNSSFTDIYGERGKPPTHYPDESWDPKSKELAEWAKESHELLEKGQNITYVKPNIKRIPDFIDIILHMQDSSYKLDEFPDFPVIYDKRTSVKTYKSPYDVLANTLEEQTPNTDNNSTSKPISDPLDAVYYPEGDDSQINAYRSPYDILVKTLYDQATQPEKTNEGNHENTE